MNRQPTEIESAREFEFVLRFDPGADELMDVFRQYESLSSWSSAIFTNDAYMWRVDHAKGTSEALEAFDDAFLDRTRCNECFDVAGCDTDRGYHVLDERATSRTIYTLRREISDCHSIPHFVRSHARGGSVFESRRVGDAYRWRVLYPGDSPIGEAFDAIEAHLRDGVSASVSRVTSVGKWGTAESIAADMSPAHWRVLEAAVAHGYYERPRKVSVADLASILETPRSTVQYRLRTAEDRIMSEIMERIS